MPGRNSKKKNSASNVLIQCWFFAKAFINQCVISLSGRIVLSILHCNNQDTLKPRTNIIEQKIVEIPRTGQLAQLGKLSKPFQILGKKEDSSLKAFLEVLTHLLIDWIYIFGTF